jgi:hypothetical protein
MPVTGFENNSQPVMPPGFDKTYDLYITIDATHPAGQVGGVFSSLNLTLWADPKNDDGTPSVSETSGPSFSNGTRNDFILATGTMVSASVSLDPTTMIREADDVVSMKPTFAGTVLLDGSIKTGSLLEVKTVTPPANFQTLPQPDGSTVFLVTDGTATVTLDPQSTILLPDIPSDALLLSSGLKFIHNHFAEGRVRHD